MAPQVSLQKIQEKLSLILTPGQISTSPSDLIEWGRDWTRVIPPQPSLVVFPKTTEQVSQTIALCHEVNWPVVPSGGRTGLVAGAVAPAGEIVLSLSRMNRMEPVDPIGLTISVEAGVTTQAVQEAAKQAGLFFPLDLAAKGSCHIGGNIATNAGGVKLIRYGGMREQVLGLEVVLADGQILDLNTAIRKNNSGYDLKQFFIGSEGTLGIVTKATLRLVQKPREFRLAIFALNKFQNILEVLKQCHLTGMTLTAFEFFTDIAHRIVLQHIPNTRSPFSESYPFYLLVEIEKTGEDELENLFALLDEKGLIENGALATTSQEFHQFWALRETITESLSAHGQVRKNDISVPIDQLSGFVEKLQKLLTAHQSTFGVDLVLFGHIGDGNLHLNYVAPKSVDSKIFQKETRDLELRVFELLPSYKGSISAEHGIGLTKKADLHFTRTPAEIQWMKSLKKMLDPKGILNPGKIFD